MKRLSHCDGSALFGDSLCVKHSRETGHCSVNKGEMERKIRKFKERRNPGTQVKS